MIFQMIVMSLRKETLVSRKGRFKKCGGTVSKEGGLWLDLAVKS